MTPANVEVRRAIMDVLPIYRAAALTAQDIAKCLGVATFHVTASLRGLYMANIVSRYRKSKKTHYWKLRV